MNDSWTFQKTIDNNNNNNSSSNNNNFSTIRRTLDTENNNSFTFGDCGMRQQSGYGPMRGQSQFRTRGGRQSNNNNNFNRFGNNNNNNDFDNDYDDDYDNYDDDDNNGNDNDMDNNMGFGNNNNNNNGWNNNGPSNNRRWVAKRGNGNNNNNNNFSSFGNNNNNNSNDFYERKQQQGGVGGTRLQIQICQNITQYMKDLGNALESESDSKMCEMLSFRHYTTNDITRIVGNVSPRVIDTLGNQYLSKNNVSFQWKEILKCNIIAQKFSNQFDIFEKQRLRKMENRLNNNNNSNDKADNGGMSENDEAMVVDQKHPLHQAYSSLQSMMEKIEIMIKADSICSKANNNGNNNNNNNRKSADENNRVWYSRCLKVLTTFWVNTTIKLHYLYVEDTNNQRDVDMSNGGNSNNNSNNNNEDDSSEDYLQKSFLTGIQIFNAMDNEIDELLRMSNKSSNNNNNMARGGIYHGLYYMANIIIRLSEVKNAPTYISDVIKATKKLDDSEYPYSDVVTTQYYYASYSIKNDKLDDAIIALQKAFNASRSAKYGGNAAFRNKVRILILYIPVKLTFAQFPKPQYLKKYGLYDHFWPIVVALRTGNLLLFESCMEYYSKDFISKDCYLLIDRLRLLVFVQLIRNIYKTQCNAENDNLTLPQGKGSEVVWFDTIQYANRLMNNEYFQSQFYKQFEYTYSKNEMKKIESFLNTNDNSDNNNNNNNNNNESKKKKENDVSNKIEETTLTLDEIAALCSTVVFKSLVKGYVAPKRCLVLSKKFYPFTRPQDAKLKNNQNKKWYEWEF